MAKKKKEDKIERKNPKEDIFFWINMFYILRFFF